MNSIKVTQVPQENVYTATVVNTGGDSFVIVEDWLRLSRKTVHCIEHNGRITYAHDSGLANAVNACVLDDKE